MTRWSYGEWFPYVPVAERRKMAAREMEKLRKKGHPVAPVILEGRTIARTFWGKAWCDNLENYHDYENRLPRGRTYVRNGSVIDLQISALDIKALVSGSSIYKVTVTIKALAPTLWRAICKDCAGGIDSLVELLQGRFSKGVMERICRQDRGLFPKPSEIRFSCTCPDGASMCKHVAAVLYGVGARFDEKPELLFRLRAVDESDLVADLDRPLPFSNRPLESGKVLETDDISALFGLDMEGAGGTMAAPGTAPATSEPVNRTGRKRAGTKAAEQKKVEESRPATAASDADTGIARWSPARNTRSAQRAPQSRSAGKATKTKRSGEPAERTPPPSSGRAIRSASREAKDTAKRKTSKPEIELTPDGFVKWWK
jgi:uncharacterized Zn finger protein